MRILEKCAAVLAIAGALAGAPQVVTEVQAAQLPTPPPPRGIVDSGRKLGGVSQLDGVVSVLAQANQVALVRSPNGTSEAWRPVDAGIATFSHEELPPTPNGALSGIVYGYAENCTRILWAASCKRSTSPTEFIYVRDITGPNIEVVSSEDQYRYREGAKYLALKVDEPSRLTVDGNNYGFLPANQVTAISVKPDVIGSTTARIEAEDKYGNKTKKEIPTGTYDPSGPPTLERVQGGTGGDSYISLDYMFHQAQADGSFTTTAAVGQRVGLFIFGNSCSDTPLRPDPNSSRRTNCARFPVETGYDAHVTVHDTYTGLEMTYPLATKRGSELPFVLQAFCGAGTVFTATALALAAGRRRRRRMKPKKGKSNDNPDNDTDYGYSSPPPAPVAPAAARAPANNASNASSNPASASSQPNITINIAVNNSQQQPQPEIGSYNAYTGNRGQSRAAYTPAHDRKGGNGAVQPASGNGDVIDAAYRVLPPKQLPTGTNEALGKPLEKVPVRAGKRQ